jgi:aminopeptidase N
MSRITLALLAALPLLPGRASAPPAGHVRVAAATAVVADSLMGPGVSLPLARLRASRIRDVRYALRLDVTGRDLASGEVSVRFRLDRATDVILDFRGPSLGEVTVNDVRASDVQWNRAHVRIPAARVRPGENVVVLPFTARIAPAGASIIRYRDATDGSDYLYTLLVPADANQLFPCFDQPDLKARIRLSLVTPPSWTAVANGSLETERAQANAKTFAFRESEPISTYLIAFAAGPWTVQAVQGSRKPIRLYVRKSRAAEVETDSLILANDRAATWLEEYFDSPFPFRKLDMVLAPAFPFGGMEHPGAIFYSEERFVFRETPTLPQRLGRTATIYHEVAHQWFGDLVTMRWFDDLWLKEGFATYMAAKMQAALDTSSGAWKGFYLRNKPVAYATDATAGTTPVWQELANLDQAKSNYGAIVYNKAPSVLKQLDHLVGERAFRDGVRRFLRRHAYANATWQDLLAVIGQSAGRPLDAWGRAYILRPGMPVLTQRVDVRDGRIARLVVSQRAAQPLSGSGAWPIRARLMLWYEGARPVHLPLVLDGDSVVVREAEGRPAPAFVYANAGDFGYALVLPDERSVAWLEGHIGEVEDPFLRAMLWGSLWDLVRDARLAPARFVSLALRELPREPDEQVVAAVLGRSTRAVRAYLGDAQRAQSIAAIEQALGSAASDGSRPYGLRKPWLDALVEVSETGPGLARLDALLDSTHAAGEPLRAPTRWAIVNRLLERGAPGAAERLAAEMRRDSTSDGRRRAFVAGVARPDVGVRRAYFTRYFADSTLNEDWATASLGAFNSLDAQAESRPFLAPALDSLRFIQQNRRIFFLGSWLGAFLGGQTSPEALQEVRTWLAAHPGLPRDLREKVLQNADELERTVRIRAAFAGGAAVAPAGTVR